MQKKNNMKTNCFELFGFDILIERDFTPWILEVNLSPSLTADSPLDFAIKAPLIADTFNLVGIRKFDRRRDNNNKIKARFKTYLKAKN